MNGLLVLQRNHAKHPALKVSQKTLFENHFLPLNGRATDFHAFDAASVLFHHARPDAHRGIIVRVVVVRDETPFGDHVVRANPTETGSH